MLKIHSFLQRVKKPLCKFLPTRIGRYKTSMAVVAYAMVTVLFILSPDYIYGTGSKSGESFAKAEVTHESDKNIVEETANEAIVETDLKVLESHFILCNLTTDGTPVDIAGLQNQNLDIKGNINTYTVLNTTNDDSTIRKELIEEKKTATQATAENKVDSSSTKEKNTKSTDGIVPGTNKETQMSETLSLTTKTTEETESSKKTETSKKETENKNKKESDKNQYKIDLSDNEIEVLQRIVEAEATGEDMKGKMLVANVILNRVENDEFPDTVKGVVFQRDGNTYQFSPIKDGRYNTVKVSKDTKKAVNRVLQGEDDSQGALYFSARSRADKSSMRWFDNHLKFLFKYGGHEFFK